MKTMINNQIYILRCMHKASPYYLIINLIKELIVFLYFLYGLLFFRFIVNYFIYSEPTMNMIVYYFFMYGLAGFTSEIFTYWTNQVFNQFQMKKIERYMNHIIYDKLKFIDFFCYEDTEFYNKYERVVNDAPIRITDTANMICSFFASLLRIITVIGLFAKLDIVFVLIAIIFCIQSLVTIKIMNKLFYQGYLQDTPINRKSNYINYVFRAFQFSKEIKLYRIHDFLIDKFNEAKDHLVLLKSKRVKELLKILFTTNFIRSILRLFVNIYVIYKIVHGNFTVGDFTLVFVSISTLSESLSDLLNVIPSIKHFNLLINQLLEIVDYTPIIKENTEGFTFNENKGVNLALNSVCFSYPNNPDNHVLSDITLNIKEGEKIIIAGENGAGKSTLLKLILGLYKLSSGEIKINDLKYDAYNTSSLKGLFGVVFQDYQVYYITIAENIMFKKELTTEEEDMVWEALEFSGLYEKIKSFPKGIYTYFTNEFGEEGVYLSGGELQRLAIARAYVRKSKILIFDEPTSALDSLTEKDIITKLNELGRDRTVICVSHRLSMAVKSDRIFVIENGSIIEEGNHKELMKNKGKYYEMFYRQSENYLVEKEYE